MLRHIRTVISTLLVVLFFVAVGWSVWSAWGTDVLSSREFRLDSARFYLPDRLPWIPSSLARDVLRESRLERQKTVLDHKLPEKLTAAFLANPWVRQVYKVQIFYPAEVWVDLEYRSPICLVEIPGGEGFYPVDFEGILLPTDYFTEGTQEQIAAKVEPFLFIIDVPANPIGGFGDTWGEKSVEQAIGLAALLGSEAKSWGIESIRILSPKKSEETLGQPQNLPEKTTYQLIATNGYSFDWGTFEFEPGSPNLANLNEEVKKEKLRKLIRQHGSLGAVPMSESL